MKSLSQIALDSSLQKPIVRSKVRQQINLHFFCDAHALQGRFEFHGRAMKISREKHERNRSAESKRDNDNREERQAAMKTHKVEAFLQFCDRCDNDIAH